MIPLLPDHRFNRLLQATSANARIGRAVRGVVSTPAVTTRSAGK
ncbi:MAG: hypothetical protein ACRC7O_11030 [Fimbriiglobus sp.]